MPMARLAPMFRRLLAACWNVLVVNAGTGERDFSPFFTVVTRKSERFS